MLSRKSGSPRWTEQRIATYIALGLVAAVLCAFSGVVRCDFIELDDGSHVIANPLVIQGVTWSSIKASFLTPHAGLWVPLTWISLMVDVSLFGMNPGAMHGVNLGMHALAVVLLFFALRRLTGRLWESAVVAALFGLHPINVESVAWVTERKNVLCAIFWMLTMLLYARYAEGRQLRWYLATAGALILALLAKPMAVTLPPALLLLDVWPLKRHTHEPWQRLVLEKLPFLLLAGFASWMQMQAVEPVSTSVVPTSVRISNAVLSYALYLRDLAWPGSLGVFYPHPEKINLVLAAFALGLLLLITWLVWLARSRRPELAIGWCWFLGNLVPMIGLVQVGGQARADRFTYIAQIGIFIGVVWLGRTLLPRKALVAVTSFWLIGLAITTARQVEHWNDSVSLFQQTLRVTGPNARISTLLGFCHAKAGDYPTAISYYEQSLTLRPADVDARNNLGDALSQLGRDQEAAEAFRFALRLRPDDPGILRNLAMTLVRLDEREEAIRLLREVLVTSPRAGDIHYELGRLLAATGQQEESARHFQIAADVLAEKLEAGSAGSVKQ